LVTCEEKSYSMLTIKFLAQIRFAFLTCQFVFSVDILVTMTGAKLNMNEVPWRS